jgi:UDP-glucose 4-epimerase
LKAAGYEPVVLDNLSKGRRSFVEGMELIEADVADPKSIENAFEMEIDAVIHFAALSEVGESVRDPLSFYKTNVGGAANLLGAMQARGVRRMVFSSSAAVYGAPEKTPIPESAPLAPISPYGATKVAVERMLADCSEAWGLKWTALRYFNAAGADPSLPCGEWHEPETHLIPNALRAAAGKKDCLDLFGVDHPTSDGSAIRDYVHVSDLADAHILALEKLEESGGAVYNLGIGCGFSVKEVIAAAEKVTGKKIPAREKPIRPGDPPVLVADSSLAKRELSWKPRCQSIEDIVASAWEWYLKMGFGL